MVFSGLGFRVNSWVTWVQGLGFGVQGLGGLGSQQRGWVLALRRGEEHGLLAHTPANESVVETLL